MYKLALAAFILTAISASDGNPVKSSLYNTLRAMQDKNQIKCPYVWQTLINLDKYNFLNDCKYPLTVETYEESLCIFYFNNFLELCSLSVSDDIVKTLLNEHTMISSLKNSISDVCDNLNKTTVISKDLNNTIVTVIKKKFANQESCKSLCTSIDDKILPICSLSSLMHNISKQLKTHPIDNSALQLHKTENDDVSKIKPPANEETANEPPKRTNASTQTQPVQEQSNGKSANVVSPQKPLVHVEKLPQEQSELSQKAQSDEKTKNVDKPDILEKKILEEQAKTVQNLDKSPSEGAANQPDNKNAKSNGEEKKEGEKEEKKVVEKQEETIEANQGGENLGGEDPKDLIASEDEDDDFDMKQDTNPDPIKEDESKVLNQKPKNTVEEDAIPASNNSGQIEEEDSFFFMYFMMVCAVFVLGYIGYHNKQKVLALVIEGRRGRRTSRRGGRPNSANYHKLDSNLEEAVTSSVHKNTTNVIY